MAASSSIAGVATPKNVIGLSVLLLALAMVFGFLNGQKVRTLRENIATADAARDASERQRMNTEKEAKARKEAADAVMAKAKEVQDAAIASQQELAQLQAEKTDFQTKLQANQAEIASLQRKIEEAGAKPENPGAASPAEMQAKLDEARRQLESAERENAFLSDKLRGVSERSSQIETEQRRPRRESAPFVRVCVGLFWRSIRRTTLSYLIWGAVREWSPTPRCWSCGKAMLSASCEFLQLNHRPPSAIS